MQLRGFILLLALVLSACGESPAPAKGQSGEKGEQGPPGPADLQDLQDRRARAERSFVLWMENVGRHALSHARRMNAFSALTRSAREALLFSRPTTKLHFAHSGRVHR